MQILGYRVDSPHQVRPYFFAHIESAQEVNNFIKKSSLTPLVAASEVDKWKTAILDKLIMWGIYTSEHDNDPQKAIVDLLNYETSVALDPKVSSEARALQQSAIPKGYKVVPDWKGYALLGNAYYRLDHSAPPRDPNLGAELVITHATEEEKQQGFKVGDLALCLDGPITPDEIVIRIGFLNEKAVLALESQLKAMRIEHDWTRYPCIPAGWCPLQVTYPGEQPEEVAYGPQIMMNRLQKWLDRYFAQVAKQKKGMRMTKDLSEALEDSLEVHYWNFDARRKGLGPWKGVPMSERDAFKAELRNAISEAQKQEPVAWKVVTWNTANDRQFLTKSEAIDYVTMNDHEGDWHIEPVYKESSDVQVEVKGK